VGRASDLRKLPSGLGLCHPILEGVHVTAHKFGRVFGPHQKLSRIAVNFQVPSFPEISTPHRQVAIPQPDIHNGQDFVSAFRLVAFCAVSDQQSPIRSNRRSAAARDSEVEGKCGVGGLRSWRAGKSREVAEATRLRQLLQIRGRIHAKMLTSANILPLGVVPPVASSR
jgi:hypothetical protein